MPDRLRSAYLYLVCLITFVMIVFASVSLVRNTVELAWPDTSSFAYEPAYAPDGKQETADDRKRREEAVRASQRRQSVLSLVGSGAMLLLAGPAYLYHWRRVQSEQARAALGPALP